MAITWDELTVQRKQLADNLLKYWLNENVFTTQWWFILFTVIIGIAIFCKLVDKKRLMEITTYGLMVILVGIIFDLAGVSFILWGYPIKLLPVLPSLFTVHLSSLPILMMLHYQYFSDWKRFTWTLIILSAIFSFIFEPFYVWAGIYEEHNWKYFYSFPVYIAIGLSLKWLMLKIKSIETNQSGV